MQTESQPQPQLTPDEVTTLIRAAVMAGMSVAIGKTGDGSTTSAEFSVIARGLLDQVRQYPSNRILQVLDNDAAKNELETLVQRIQDDDPNARKLQDIRPFALRRCDELAEILDNKATPQEADEVKQTIIAMCQRVAGESREGGFLGFGGQSVSREENAVINEVARALKTSLPAE